MSIQIQGHTFAVVLHQRGTNKAKGLSVDGVNMRSKWNKVASDDLVSTSVIENLKNFIMTTVDEQTGIKLTDAETNKILDMLTE